MNKTVKILLISFFLILAGAILVGIGFMAGGQLNREETTPVTHTVTQDFHSIFVTVGAANIRLKPSQNGKTYAVCEESEKIKYTLETENGTLYLTEEDNRHWYEYIGFFFGSRKVTLYLAASELVSLDIKNGSGDISCTEKSLCFEKTDLKCASGNVDFQANSTESLAIELASGNIAVSHVTAKAVSLKTASGDILFDGDAADSLTAESASGKIQLKNASPAVLTAKAASGDIRLSSIRAGSISCKASSGAVVLENVLSTKKTTVEVESGEISLTKCDAGEYSLSTASGDIEAHLLSDKIFDVESASGSTSFPPSIKNAPLCRARTASGNIRITVE